MKVLLPFSTSLNATEVDDIQTYSEMLFSLGRLKWLQRSVTVFTVNHCALHQAWIFLPFCGKGVHKAALTAL